MQVPGGYGPVPSGYTTSSRYRAALVAKKEDDNKKMYNISSVEYEFS